MILIESVEKKNCLAFDMETGFVFRIQLQNHRDINLFINKFYTMLKFGQEYGQELSSIVQQQQQKRNRSFLEEEINS